MRPGEIVAERFAVEHQVGAGGMGRVYRAIDRLSGAPIALKLMKSSAADEAARERFQREGAILAQLDHPGFVRHVAHGATGEGDLYLAMEWLEGESLAARLRRGPLPPADAIRVLQLAARPLQDAHRKGIVHRDIKPSNLFLVGGKVDDVKVLDLGIARLVNAATLTGTGMVLGTPHYMAPEQVRGAHDIDCRVDVFALGCVLHECLCGAPPFAGREIMAVLAKILLEEAPALDVAALGAPDGVDLLVAAMLAKDPALRPADAGVVASALAALREPSVDGRASLPAYTTHPGITAGEHQLVALVMASLVDPGASTAPTGEVQQDGTTLDPSPPATLIGELSAAAATFGGELMPLGDVSLVVRLSARGAATDLAQRAAQCALGLEAIAPDAGLAIAMGQSQVARPVGDLVERAARMLRSAWQRSGRRAIEIDEVTSGLLDASFEVGGDDRGMVLLGRVVPQVPARTLLGKPTSLVGRDRELLTLEAVFAECGGELVPRAVVVTGQPGVGKSRLRYELVRRLRERPEPVEIWLARGEQLTAGSPLGMLAMAVRRAAGVRDGEPRSLQRQRLRGRVLRHLDEETGARILPFIGELAGIQFADDAAPLLRPARENPMLMAEQMKRAWQEWLAAECAAQPVLLVLEDLHWGDLPTVQFIDRALANLPESPLMVLALARPEVDTLFPDLWAGRNVTRIALAELSRRAAQKLIREVLGDAVDDNLLASLIDRAAGNAFFLEELIRGVAEGGDAALPATVLAMLQARLEALPGDARRTLRAASLFGTAFWRGGVAAVLGGERRAADLDQWLEFLQAREVISARPEGKFPGEREFVFRHTLVREAAYQTLTEEDRRLAHRLAGEWLEGTGESDPRVLAEHFERGGEPQHAAAWYLRAAERMLADGIPEVALDYARRADQLGLADELTARLVATMYLSGRYLGRPRDTASWIQDRLARPQALEARAILHELMIASLRMCDVEATLRLADEALEVVGQAGNREARAHILSHAAAAAYRRGDVVACDRYAAMAAAESFETTRGRFYALRAQMFASTLHQDYDRAAELSTQALSEALALGDLASAANESNNLAESHLELGHPEQAAEAGRRALEFANLAGHRQVAEYASGMIAFAEAEAGRYERIGERMAAPYDQPATVLTIDVVTFGSFHLLERGEPGDAERIYALAPLAIADARRIGMLVRLVGLLAGHSRALRRIGESEAARDQLAAARELLDTADDFALYHTAIACAEVLGRGDPQAAAILERARARLMDVAARRADAEAYLRGQAIRRRLLAVLDGPRLPLPPLD